MIILVLGVGFFLAYQLTNLGPAGKVSVGLLVAAVMLGGGIRLERNERYRIPARALIGGGWALLYFVAFAMYYVPAAKVLQSQAVDLLLMMAVATAMVWHTLRYDSQVVTGLAFLLGFTTITIHHSAVLSLAAGAILAAGLIAVVLWKRWYELEVLGILAAYLNHLYWLMPIVSQLTPANRHFPEFPMSTTLLALYWAGFRASYLVRKIDEEAQENVSTVAALLNGGLFLAILKYQAAHPEWAFWALLVLGAVELALGQLPNAKRRRMPFIVLTIIGASLMVAAIPFRYSGNSVAVLWLVEGEALFLAGIWAREIVFRRLGMLVTLLVTLQLLIQTPDAYATYNWRLGVSLLVSAATFYFDHLWFGRRKRELFTHELDAGALRVISFFGALALLEAVAVMASDTWMAVGWMTVALLLATFARAVDSDDISLQAIGLAVVGVMRAVYINLETEAAWHGMSLRLLTVGCVAILSYAIAVILRPKRLGDEIAISPAFSWAGSVLVALLCWYELRPVLVATGWAVLGLLLLETGLWFRSRHLRWQSYVALVAAFLRAITSNLDAAGAAGAISPRLYSILPMALILYYAYRRLETSERVSGDEIAGQIAGLFTWMASLLIGLLCWYELRPIAVAVAWAIFGLILFEAGISLKSWHLRFQSYIALAAAFVRMYFVNINAAGAGGEISPRVYTIVPLALIFFYVYVRTAGNEMLQRHGEGAAGMVGAYMGTATLASLAFFELPRIWVAAGWSGMCVLLLAVGWRSARRIFVHQGVALSLPVVWRGISYNLLQTPNLAAGVDQRWATAGSAVLGLCAALGAGFLARRKQEEAPNGAALLFDYRPEQALFFSMVTLLTVMLAFVMRSGMITVSWGLEGVAVFLFALLAGERSFRLCGLGLLLLCVGKILIVDFWSLGLRDKWITLIILGAALMLVSFLYSRYREAIRQYL